MVVRTDKPDAAQKQVTDYLTSNQIEWRSAEPQGQAARSLDYRNRAEANEAAAASPQAPLEQQSQVLARAAGVSPSTRPVQGIAAPESSLAACCAAGKPRAAEGAQAPAPAYPTNSLFNNSLGAAANGLYVARMSRTQARALTLTLNQLPQQAAEVKDVVDGGVAAPPAGVELNAPTTQPAESFGETEALRPRNRRPPGGSMPISRLGQSWARNS